MFDITTLTTILAILIGVATWAGLSVALRDADPVDLAAMFGGRQRSAWPRGVQEEEPFSWHLELLDRRAEPTSLPSAAAGPAPNARPSALQHQDRAA
jgi:hypothetical protein